MGEAVHEASGLLQEVFQQRAGAKLRVETSSVFLVADVESALSNLNNRFRGATQYSPSANESLDDRAQKSERRREELELKIAPNALAVVKDHRPIAHQKVVIFAHRDQLARVCLFVHEELKLRA